jgi:hypothetical protein
LSGKRQRPPFRLGQSLHLDGGDLLEPEQFRGRVSAVAGDDDAVLIDQNRHHKAEGGDAVGNLADLFA